MSSPFPELEEDDPPRGSAQGLRTLRLFLWAAVLLMAGMGLWAWLGDKPAAPAATVTTFADSVGGPFTLTAPDGSTVTEQTLAGKPFAIFFGFTRCPDVCPTSLAKMARLRKALGPDGDKFAIVFVSVDPGYDKPEDIGRYVDLFGTPIIGLTGNDEQLAQIVAAYHVFYEKVPVEGGDYTIDHTAAVYLMDRAGKLQSIIDYHEDEDTALAKLRRLVA
jgi:protein SCO1